MPVCVRSFVVAIVKVLKREMALTPPDLIIMDGGQGQVNVAKDASESGTEIGNSLEFDFVVPPPHS